MRTTVTLRVNILMCTVKPYRSPSPLIVNRLQQLWDQHQTLNPLQLHQTPLPWCKCGVCIVIPQQVENKCCGQRRCVTTFARFSKLCLDPDVLQLCTRNRADIRNDRDDNSTRAFRKASYRQFILDRYGYLGKGNRKVCPSCVVKTVRGRYPSQTGVYMGYTRMRQQQLLLWNTPCHNCVLCLARKARLAFPQFVLSLVLQNLFI